MKGCICSIGIYRLYFNPLRKFPGYTFAALTKWQSYWIARRGGTHFHLHKAHEKFGDYIRVGPNEISVADPEYLPIIHGARSKFPKGPWYFKNLNKPEPALFSLRDFEEHRKRRRVWDTASGTRALQAYEPRIRACMEGLLRQFDYATSGQVFDFRKWIELLAFDIMGQVSFVSLSFTPFVQHHLTRDEDVDFHMVETGRKHRYVEFVHTTLKYVASLAAISWIMPIVFLMPLTPHVRETTAQFVKFGHDSFLRRMKQGAKQSDVFGFLLKEGENDPSAKMSDQLLEAEIRSIIVGGSDTTAVAMKWASDDPLKAALKLTSLKCRVLLPAPEQGML